EVGPHPVVLNDRAEVPIQVQQYVEELSDQIHDGRCRAERTVASVTVERDRARERPAAPPSGASRTRPEFSQHLPASRFEAGDPGAAGTRDRQAPPGMEWAARRG